MHLHGVCVLPAIIRGEWGVLFPFPRPPTPLHDDDQDNFEIRRHVLTTSLKVIDGNYRKKWPTWKALTSRFFGGANSPSQKTEASRSRSWTQPLKIEGTISANIESCLHQLQAIGPLGKPGRIPRGDTPALFFPAQCLLSPSRSDWQLCQSDSTDWQFSERGLGEKVYPFVIRFAFLSPSKKFTSFQV